MAQVRVLSTSLVLQVVVGCDNQICLLITSNRVSDGKKKCPSVFLGKCNRILRVGILLMHIRKIRPSRMCFSKLKPVDG